MKPIIIADFLSVSAMVTAQITSFSNADALRAERPIECIAAEDVTAYRLLPTSQQVRYIA
ncbi:MAG: hypothetical protein COB30_016710 [Ectothiorhodospiraceae bacterium]|nr:hypothetical protein [Ectothiorhodospiraceae bacterium]